MSADSRRRTIEGHQAAQQDPTADRRISSDERTRRRHKAKAARTARKRGRR